MSRPRSRRRAGLGSLAGLVAVAAAGIALIAATQSTSSSPTPPRTSLPAGPEAAFTVPEPEPLGSASETRWAPVARAVTARATPGGRAVARLSTRTPEATTNLVTITGRLRDRAGTAWVQVRLPVLPNGTTGWVPRRSLGGYRTVQTQLRVDRRRLTAELFRGERRIFRTRVGIGQDRWPTPAGRFYVRVKLTRFASPMYGPLAFGLSARSAVLTDWPAGGYVGIHGTDRPDLLPGRVSHGCIRMTNRAILELGRLMPVGTPVIVT